MALTTTHTTSAVPIGCVPPQAPPQTKLNHPFGPCPDWCARHEIDELDCRWHVSAPQVWGKPESPTFEFELVRHDAPDASEISSVGATDFNFRVFFSDDDPDDAFDGYMEVSWVRDLTAFLGTLLMTADPHNTNGDPLEWHTPVRRPLLGLER